MRINTLPFGTKIKGKKQAAFVAITSGHIVWEGYEGVSEMDRARLVPMGLLLRRWDGRSGFPGGIAEEDESLVDAVAREVDEEIGWAMSRAEIKSLVPVVTHELDTTTTNLFSIGIHWHKAKQILSGATHAKHFGSEITGLSFEHLLDYEHRTSRRGIAEVFRLPFAPGAREQLVHLVSGARYVSRADLEEACLVSGFDLAELLGERPEGPDSTLHLGCFDGGRRRG